MYIGLYGKWKCLRTGGYRFVSTYSSLRLSLPLYSRINIGDTNALTDLKPLCHHVNISGDD